MEILYSGVRKMKKFEFKLNKVLEVRQIEEDQAQNRLLEAQQKERDIKEEILNLQEKQNDLYQYLRNNEGITLEENMLYRKFIQINRQNIKDSEKSLLAQQEEVRLLRGDFLEKRKKREVLEKLKEKNYKHYYKEMLLKEQKVLDEIGIRAQGIRGYN